MSRKGKSRKPKFGMAADLGSFAKELGEVGIHRRRSRKLSFGPIKIGAGSWLAGSGARKPRKSTRKQALPISTKLPSGLSLALAAIIGVSLIIGTLFKQHQDAAILVGMSATIAACCGVYYALKRSRKERNRQEILAIEFEQIDAMTGHAFEHYIGGLLQLRGFQAKVTRGSGDNGVDIIAVKDADRWAIQCKRQATNVSRTAISDAVAARHSTMFDCNKAMVITNQGFTSAAIEYARSTSCALVDREVLSDWIQEEKSNRSVPALVAQSDDQRQL